MSQNVMFLYHYRLFETLRNYQIKIPVQGKIQKKSGKASLAEETYTAKEMVNAER